MLDNIKNCNGNTKYRGRKWTVKKQRQNKLYLGFSAGFLLAFIKNYKEFIKISSKFSLSKMFTNIFKQETFNTVSGKTYRSFISGQNM